MANIKHALIDPVITYKPMPQPDVSLKKKKKKKAVKTTVGGALGGLAAPPPQGYSSWVEYSKSPEGMRQGSDMGQAAIANAKLARLRGEEQVISPSFLQTTLTRLGEISENMKALTTINENVISLNENVKSLLEASQPANSAEEEEETNNSQEGGRRRRRQTKRKGRKGTRRR
jgi:hypothetical protein